jgi:ketosteroid isomerase-like protein
MNKSILSLLLLVVLFSCSEKKTVSDSQELIDADIAFSDFSVKYGIQKAFIEFAHDSVVLLKPNRWPIIGKQSLIESYNGTNDSNLILKWEPAKAVIAKSGELGYTYGFWTFINQIDTSRGTYLTVWKKDPSGHWKYIADTGNEGLGK